MSFPIWQRTDFASECYDMDGPEEALAFVWMEGSRWMGEVDGMWLNDKFETQRLAEVACEQIINDREVLHG